MSDVSIVAFGAVSALGEGRAAFDAGVVGEGARTAIGPDDELTRARRTLWAIVQDFEPSPAADEQVADLVAHGLPENLLSGWVERIDAVTAADVRRAAETYLHPDQMKIVVAGDRKVVEAQLRALGLPGLVVLDADGVRHGS